MSWELELDRYIEAPLEAWPADRPLQAQKLIQCLARRLNSCPGTTLAAMSQEIRASATRRVERSIPTLFLINCGSSGSHWVEAMLASLDGIRTSSEVYVPPRLGHRLDGLPKRDRAQFLDALHQIHVEGSVPASETDVLINSAHSWNPHDLMGDAAIAVLLVRDPLDVVVSRTFRKPRLRRHLAPAVGDAEYLERNVVFVEKFYRSALRRRPAYVVRYEDFLDRPSEPLARLAALLGRRAAQPTLEAIAARHSAEAQRNSGARLSNVYKGSQAPPPGALLETAARELAGIRSTLGYA